MQSPTSYESAEALLSDLDPFLAYLESTSEDAWQVDVVRSSDGTRNCMFGHLYQWGSDHPSVAQLDLKSRERLASHLWEAFEQLWATTYAIYPINDGKNSRYPQPTPRQRVLAYLKALQRGEELTTMQAMEQECERHQAAQKESEDIN